MLVSENINNYTLPLLVINDITPVAGLQGWRNPAKLHMQSFRIGVLSLSSSSSSLL